jgi:1-acyl-sn-glycerol-3-phosphate acyltransferase
MQRGDNRAKTENPLWDRFSRVVCYPYFAAFHRLRWEGAENVPGAGPAIVVCNHQSFYDPVVLTLAARRRIYYLGWEKYFGVPVLGALMRSYGAVSVDVFRPEPRAYGRLVEALRNDGLCGIFPEGGRSRDGLPRQIKAGAGALALRTGAPVVPATIWGGHRAWPPRLTLPRPEPMEVIFQPPVRVSELSAGGEADRVEVTYSIMHKVADGFRLLGHPRMAARWHGILEKREVSR